MVAAILGTKIGMTRIFDDVGGSIPVTVVQAGPCPILQVKTGDNDGYEASLEAGKLYRGLRDVEAEAAGLGRRRSNIIRIKPAKTAKQTGTEKPTARCWETREHMVHSKRHFVIN